MSAMRTMRAACAVWAVWAAGACDDGGSTPADAAQDGLQADAGDAGPVEPGKVSDLKATLVAPWRGEGPGAFSANVAQECRYLASGQLYITGTALSDKGAESLELRIGIFETVDLSGESQTFEIVPQPENGAKVTLGKAALGFGFEDPNGATINLSHVLEGSTVTVSSLDPCTGTFQAKIAALDPNGAAITIELNDGTFAITRSASSPAP